MRHKGHITTWNDDRGFGFITPIGGGERVFMHIRAYGPRGARPQQGDLVLYTLGKDEQGRTRAQSVTPADLGDTAAASARRQAGARRFPLSLVSGGFLLLMTLMVLVLRAPLVIILAYAVLSVVSYGAYALDKNAAQSGRWRTQESTLHLLDLLGGWPGGLLAQQRLRHKSRKTEFQVVFWATVVLNCAVLTWLLTPGGGGLLNEFLAGWLN